MLPWLEIIAGASLALWIYLLGFRGDFWLTGEMLPKRPRRLEAWPQVMAIVPARNEADVIGETISALLTQAYPIPLSVILVDDQSDDGTAEAARRAAEEAAGGERLTIVNGTTRPDGWVGKVWALQQGVAEAERTGGNASAFYWFTDADIVHDLHCLRRLVAKAVTSERDIVSLMVKLSCRSFWERLLIPPFVFFFKKLYPFKWVNRDKSKVAGAAGGCVLVRREALEGAGGLSEMKGALIDDCTLADLIKSNGRDDRGHLWLGLTETSHSVRGYDGLSGIWSMVARSAYTQLDFSVLKLIGTMIGMTLMYLLPPLLALTFPLHGSGIAFALGIAAWVAMMIAFTPTLRFYGQSIFMAPLLPVGAALYTAMTLDSARAHWRGEGGKWKGRVQGNAA